MIRITNADALQDRIEIIYNPLSELSLGLDVLSNPERNKLHSAWSSGVLQRLSLKERQQLEYFEDLLDGYLNIDRHYNFLSFDFNSDNNFSACSAYLKSPEYRISALGPVDFEQLTSFLSFMWDNYILPVVEEHSGAVKKQIEHGNAVLVKDGYRALFAEISERVSLDKGGRLSIQKYIESEFDALEMKKFYIEASIFAFPYLVVSDRHPDGYFFLSWDVPFDSTSRIIPGIEAVSSAAFALSDKSRLRMLLLLSESPMTQAELTRLMGFAKSTVSRHMNILIDCGFIRQEGEGRNIMLSLNRKALERLSAQILDWLD